MITVKITRAELVRHGACEGGLALFDRACELGGVECLEMEWTPLHDVWLAVVHSDFASWLRAEKIIPRANMSGSDMRGADMRGANMRGANMRGADMSYADMSYADMRGADMRGANMRGADMSYADMRGADMSYADMRGADMRGANMRDANMSDADMSDANMRGAIWPADVPTPEGWRLVDGRLVRASWPSP